MRRSFRRAAVNKFLLTGLIVLAAGAGLYWGVLRTPPVDPTKIADAGEEHKISCTKCGPQVLNGVEAQNIEVDLATNKKKCPKCGQFTADWGSGGARRPGGGG
ncbi:MAG: hypothetical protein HRU75_11960 [Planctomycetia bacterium]|nr:MAG: hypothetical protein HRU75_11960 [Planctomycetia bacterium]